MSRLKKNLAAISRDLKSLSKKIDALIEELDKAPSTPPTSKAGTKSASQGRQSAAGKTKAKSHKSATESAAQVVEVIQRAKKGIDIPTIILKTGLEAGVVQAIIRRNQKKGKIVSLVKGVYTIATRS